MPGTLGVWLDKTRVGSLTNLGGDYNLFAFDDDYRADPNRPVLSQGLISSNGDPLHIVPRSHTAAPPFFSNALPEPDSLLRELIARQHDIKRAPDFGFLCALGEDLPGAVRVRPESAAQTPDVSDEAANAAGGAPLKFSLAGVQLKFSASMHGDRLTIPTQGGSWIVKLPAVAYARLPENEYAMMRFARAIGLRVPSIELVDLATIENLPHNLPALRDDEPKLAYAIERFDRCADGARVHAEDFNQIAGQPPTEKYEHKTTEYVASVVSQLCPSEDVEELIARIVFGVAIGNGDMHLKNWGVVYPDGRNARLAPLYDFISTSPYFPKDALALSLGGEKRYDRITGETLADFAAQAEISVKMARRVAAETIERMRVAWPAIRQTVPDGSLVTAVEAHAAATPLARAFV
jgi:serine/threonine-protein kinase HipA